MTQMTLPVISLLSSSKSPCTTENQQCDVSQVFVQRVSPTDISYDDFFRKYLLQNQPCIFSSELTQGWLSRRHWVNAETGKPNLACLRDNFGDAVAPVANCGQEKFSSHCKEEMRMREFLDYWGKYISEGHPQSQKCLYLKDWHFTKAFPSYQAYSTPVYFLSDWMNEFWDCRADSEDDYRFVYMGPKGSWTPFHADVFRSYSWSANICGRKQWIFIAPGEEEKYRNKFGNLVYDINSDELNDPEQYPSFSQSAARIEVIQEPGEVIFVPSGWHHQVHNLEDTISINHNWMNGCNIHRCWDFLKQDLSDVQREISDCQDMEGWQEQCQLILKASSGIDYTEFYQYLVTIATHRMDFLQLEKDCEDMKKLNLQSSGIEHSNKHDLRSPGADHSGVHTEPVNSHYKSDGVEGELKVKCESKEDVKKVFCDSELKYLMDKDLTKPHSPSSGTVTVCDGGIQSWGLSSEEVSMPVTGEQVDVSEEVSMPVTGEQVDVSEEVSMPVTGEQVDVSEEVSMPVTGEQVNVSEEVSMPVTGEQVDVSEEVSMPVTGEQVDVSEEVSMPVTGEQVDVCISCIKGKDAIDQTEKSEESTERYPCQCEIHRCQSDRKIDMCQSDRQIGTCQSDRHVDMCQSDRQIDTCQSDIHIDTCQSDGQIDTCQSDRQIDTYQSDRQIDTYQSDRQIDTCQSDRQIDTCQSDRKVDMCQSDGQIDTCQSDGQIDTCQSDRHVDKCTRSERETESQTGSLYHATFDLIQVKQILVDMLNTEEFKLIKTKPSANSVIDRIDRYVL